MHAFTYGMCALCAFHMDSCIPCISFMYFICILNMYPNTTHHGRARVVLQVRHTPHCCETQAAPIGCGQYERAGRFGHRHCDWWDCVVLYQSVVGRQGNQHPGAAQAVWVFWCMFDEDVVVCCGTHDVVHMMWCI